MKIRKLTATNEQKSKELWQQAFPDSDEFVKAYYGARDNVGNAWGMFEDGKLLSQLFLLPFTAKVMESPYDTDFISGCATREEARGKNLMRDLLHFSLENMRQRNISVCFLHPFLHAFYKKFEFETVAYVKKYTYRNPGIKHKSEVTVSSALEGLPVDELHAAYTNYVSAFDNCFLRNRERFETWLAMLFADGGKIAWTRSGGRISYALYYPEKQGIADVFELVFFSKEELFTLLDYFGKANFFLPENIDIDAKDLKPEEHTMMRVLDPKAVLECYPFENGIEIVIEIKDRFLGRDYKFCVKTERGVKQVFECGGSSHIAVDIARFAKLVTGSFREEEAPEIKGIFKQGTSCFFETY